jgi:glutamyl-tRNA synthetase
MQRMDRYREVLADMLARGLAYRCYMQPDELEALRAAQLARGEKPRYDGRWRPENATALTPPAGVAPVIRFKNPLARQRGLGRSDQGPDRNCQQRARRSRHRTARMARRPTTSVSSVDDLDMRITDVVRGDDHVNNTPRQINIIRALGAQPPVYAHVPTVLGEDGHKLSKRHGAVSVMQYEEMGYLPEAMVNFLARLGWSHGDAEIFSRDELVQWFDLAHVSPSPSRFDTDKLKWVNQEHLKRLHGDELGRRLAPYLKRAGLDPAAGPDPADVAILIRDRVATLTEMADAAHYFYATPHPGSRKNRRTGQCRQPAGAGRASWPSSQRLAGHVNRLSQRSRPPRHAMALSLRN